MQNNSTWAKSFMASLMIILQFRFKFAALLLLFGWSQAADAQEKSGAGRVENSSYEDIAVRVRLALQYMDNNPDPDQSWMPYFGAIITGSPSHYSHNLWDAETGWRMVEQYLLARQVLDQARHADIERKLRAFVLGTIRKDGLAYRPDKPWCKPDASMWDNARALIVLATWLRLEPSDQVAEVARGIAEGLAGIALREKDYWHFPSESWTGTEWVQRELDAFPPTGLAIEGLVDLAGLLKDERYLDMAGQFVRAVLSRKPPLFAEDGSMVRMGGGPYHFAFTHVHARLWILTGLLKYALATHDEQLHAWCIRAYFYVKEEMSSSFGWVSESLESGTDPGVSMLSSRRRDEVCCISDMMQMASLLTHNGMPAERSIIGWYGTNQIFAHQLPEYAPIRHLLVTTENISDTPQDSYRGMPERCLGSFTAGTYPNDLCVDLRSFGMSEFSIDAAGCCSLAGLKALYFLWREAVERSKDSIHVYLWATLENKDIAMYCDEPKAGKLRIVMKQACGDLLIHLPDYVAAKQLKASRGKLEDDCILSVGKVKPGEVITVTYPLSDRRTREEIAGKEYQIDWRGGRVVRIGPPAAGCDPYWWRAEAQ